MKFVLDTKLWLVAGVLTALVVASTGAAYAHERRDVDQYQFVVGFIVEPAFEGLKNGLDLQVSKKAPADNTMATGDEVDVPVEGLQDTLQAEVTHVATGTTKLLSLRTIFNDPGHYTADLIPTAPGIYQFHIFGTVEGSAVDETFVSRGGGGGFGDIESSDDLQFPQKLTEVREVEAAVRGAQDTAQQAQDTAIQADGKASSANNLGVIAIVLGAVGIASGVGGVALGVRRR
jgi:hypothetical protein